jgi:hypothetical protein
MTLPAGLPLPAVAITLCMHLNTQVVRCMQSLDLLRGFGCSEVDATLFSGGGRITHVQADVI